MRSLPTTRTMTQTALLAAAGISLFVLESFVPLPVPFFKIGFSNISPVLALILLGPVPMGIVALLRIIAGSMLTGSMLTPSFLLALAGGVAALGAMTLVWFAGRRSAGPVGISLAGATGHVLAQYAVVSRFFAGGGDLSFLLPWLLASALLGGLVVGLVSRHLVGMLARAGFSATPVCPPRKALTATDALLAGLLLAGIVSTAFSGGREQGDGVSVSVDGSETLHLQLGTEGMWRVPGARGEVTVVVRAGGIAIMRADCPDHRCIRTGVRSAAGEVIVCVPNRVVVRIEGGWQSGPRAVTG